LGKVFLDRIREDSSLGSCEYPTGLVAARENNSHGLESPENTQGWRAGEYSREAEKK
jgi:hypothetical protein